MLDTFEQAVPALQPGLRAGMGRLRRVRVRIAPAALQVALVSGRPEGWRPRPVAEPVPGRPDWIEGSFRFGSYDTAVRELLSLGSEVEVLLPVELRETMAGIGQRLAELHR
jgi:predicted DNA-binding transcriptional regulator YafY